MVKGVAIKCKSYGETIPQLLKLIKLDHELKKHASIVIKPYLTNEENTSTPVAFMEQIVRFCVEHKAAGTEIFIAEGAEGHSTQDLFHKYGFDQLGERYGLGIVDLNKAECEEVRSGDFLGFEMVQYPTILKQSFVISAPRLVKVDETELIGSLAAMRGAYPARYYKGFFSAGKNKLNVHPLKYQINDIVACKMPNLAIIDAPEQGYILAGKPIDMDKQGAKLLGIDWRAVSHLRTIDETLGHKEETSVTTNT